MKIKIDENINQRIDQYLADYYEDISRSKLSTLIKNGDVLVNNSKVKPSYLININDEIDIDLDALDLKPILAENLNIEILYQDEDIAVINKPIGIISHPTEKIRSNTVVNFLLNKFNKLPTVYGEDRAGIVHRLDKDTSGLMIIALNEKSMIKLKEMFKNRDIIKKYRTIVNNRFNETEGLIEKNIARSSINRKLMSVSEEGKYAKTGYRVIKQTSVFAYLDVTLYTGRTHQIRVHMKSINHPILGDLDYNNIKNKYNISAQLLQAYLLEFKHPISNKNLKIEIPMYPEFKKYYNIIFEEYNESGNTNI